MKLPLKPAAVEHVSDAHWKAALDEANPYWRTGDSVGDIIDHARCLILLGEVLQPADLISIAIRAMFNDINFNDISIFDACRKHFAGLTFPAVAS